MSVPVWSGSGRFLGEGEPLVPFFPSEIFRFLGACGGSAALGAPSMFAFLEAGLMSSREESISVVEH